MAARIRELAALDADRLAMPVSVIAPPHEQWPLPWYLRTLTRVGYWTAPDAPEALQAPVIVASMAQTAALDAALGERYVSELFGLRPDVLLTLYIERGLWERFLAAAAGTSPSASRFAPAGVEHCPHLRAVALWRATPCDGTGTLSGRAVL
jgi:hypothetical protein